MFGLFEYGFNFIDFFMLVVISVSTIIFGIFLFLEIMWAMQEYGPYYQMDAVVKSQSHKDSTYSSGVGTGLGLNGQITTVVTTSHIPESFDTTFYLSSGKLWSVDDRELFTSVSVGQKVVLTFKDKTLWGSKRSKIVGWREQ
jgi:hypothetical protein